MIVRGNRSSSTRSTVKWVAAAAAFAAATAAASALHAGASVTAVAPAAGAAVAGASVVGGAAATADALAEKATSALAFYTFDGDALLDISGHSHTLRVVARNGGATRVVAHGTGKALAFPKKCTGRSCPRVALRAKSATELNPGRRPLAFGASVLLAQSQTTKGQNVLQKGYSARGSQYKLQIDGAAGRPSCALVDAQKKGIRLAHSSVSVADGEWHTVECRRSGKTLTIVVDGVTRGSTAIPAKLTVSNDAPLSIGGKGAYSDNDQFQGVLDDVWVRVG
jgi:hypothetical protein